jgi:hypothetical protein
VRALLVIAVLALASCDEFRRPEPVPAQCDAMCFEPCVGKGGDTGIRWEADATDPAALDALGGEVVPALAEQLRTCEVRRKACVQCLERLDKHRVIQL